jgi:hypothetical protein
VSSHPQIAFVSLRDTDRDPDSFAQKLGRSFEEYGFAIIANHGMPEELIHRAEEKAKAFFALPDEVKRQYHVPGGGGARGYTPFGIETAKGAKAHDLKEFWHVGRELPPGHKFRTHMPANVWPEEIESFRDTFLELYDTFDRTSLKLLRAIARYLRIDEDFLEDAVRDGNSVLRLLHYPPIEGMQSASGGQLRSRKFAGPNPSGSSSPMACRSTAEPSPLPHNISTSRPLSCAASNIACRQPPHGVQTISPLPPTTAMRATLSRPNACCAAVRALCSAHSPRR